MRRVAQAAHRRLVGVPDGADHLSDLGSDRKRRRELAAIGFARQCRESAIHASFPIDPGAPDTIRCAGAVRRALWRDSDDALQLGRND
jgi:hypothetical protein